MVVNTRHLFARLLSRLQISVVCDVGSMDGADALMFRDAAPGSSIYAFEPNPRNFQLMEANRALRERNIQLVPLAATNYDGEADFFLVAADYSRREAARGVSSLHRRSGEWAPADVVRVGTVRLDSFLAGKCAPPARLALWIDTEGKAYEVIEGVTRMAHDLHMLHVEVETSPLIGANQRLYPEVKTLLERLGFAEVATDQARSKAQFNALFVRSDLPAVMRTRVQAWLVRAGLRQLIVAVVRRVCPACLRRYQAMRLRALDSSVHRARVHWK